MRLFSCKTFAVAFETVKTTKVSSIKTYPLYGIMNKEGYYSMYVRMYVCMYVCIPVDTLQFSSCALDLALQNVASVSTACTHITLVLALTMVTDLLELLHLLQLGLHGDDQLVFLLIL